MARRLFWPAERPGTDRPQGTEQIRTTTPAGRLQFHIFGGLAEFEREVIRERTRAGLAAEKVAIAGATIAHGEQSVTAVARALGVGRTTLYRHLALNPAPRPGEASVQ